MTTLALLIKKPTNHGVSVLLMLAFVVALVACTPDVNVKVTEQAKPEITENVNFSDKDLVKYQEGVDALKGNDFTQAENIFTDLTHSYPHIAGPFCNLAIIYFKASDNESALKLINRAIELSDTIPQAYNLRAQIMIIKGKIKEAELDYSQAIAIDPTYINAQYNLALLYDIYLQDVRSALKHYEIYLSLIQSPDETTRDWANHLRGSLNNG